MSIQCEISIEIEKFEDSLIAFRNNTRKVLKNWKQKKIDELEELEKKIFLAIKNRSWEGRNSIKEEIKFRKITRKKENEIERLETEIKDKQKLKQ